MKVFKEPTEWTPRNEPQRYYIRCPACEDEFNDGTHVFTDNWQFNKDMEKPTISPSLLVKGSRWIDKKGGKTKPYICHSFIKDGKIQFLNDCTHKLAGQTVDLLDYEKE